MRFLSKNRTEYLKTKREANYFLSIVEDALIKKVKCNERYAGFRYLAIRKNNFYYYLELGYSKKFLSTANLKILESLIKIKLPVYVVLKSRSLDTTKQEVDNFIANNDFRKSKLNSGDEIEAYNTGTLGGFVKLKNKKGIYLISNAHVLIGKKGKLGRAVKNINGEKIGKVFWGVLNERYDVALAKVNKKYPIKESEKAIISKPTFKNKKIKSIGMYGTEGGNLYSTNALVKLGQDFFKNQLLIKNLDFISGDSGSVIMERKKPNNIIGLYIGGNNEIKVANNLYNLFIKDTPKIKDSYEKKITVQFKTFYKP